MGSILPVYLDNDWVANYEARFNKYLKDRGIAKNRALLEIIKNYLDTNPNYNMHKLDEFPALQEAQQTSLFVDDMIVCKECGATKRDIDEKGFVIHDKGCSYWWSKNVVEMKSNIQKEAQGS